jgi:hypothetical protein
MPTEKLIDIVGFETHDGIRIPVYEVVQSVNSMKPFNRMLEAYEWVERIAQGHVCVVQNNARILMNPWCRGDMRVIEVFHEWMWQ